MDKMRSGEGWKWYGHAGHFICASRCVFHLTTRVGEHLISTVGGYQPEDSQGFQEIGCNRLYETYVFECVAEDADGNPDITNWQEIDSRGYNDSRKAERGHYEMCWKYEERQAQDE